MASLYKDHAELIASLVDSTWEALIVVGSLGVVYGRRAGCARSQSRKPIAFCAWLFDCLGMVPGDHLVDLFPGTGIVTRSWEVRCRDRSISCGSGGPDARRPRVLSERV